MLGRTFSLESCCTSWEHSGIVCEGSWSRFGPLASMGPQWKLGFYGLTPGVWASAGEVLSLTLTLGLL